MDCDDAKIITFTFVDVAVGLSGGAIMEKALVNRLFGEELKTVNKG